jgi:hypothetical protein
LSLLADGSVQVGRMGPQVCRREPRDGFHTGRARTAHARPVHSSERQNALPFAPTKESLAVSSFGGQGGKRLVVWRQNSTDLEESCARRSNHSASPTFIHAIRIHFGSLSPSRHPGMLLTNGMVTHHPKLGKARNAELVPRQPSCRPRWHDVARGTRL